MQRTILVLGFALILSLGVLLACQRDAPPKPTPLPTSERIAYTPIPNPSPTSSKTVTPTPTHPPTSTPTITPTPTPTPIPSDRLVAAQQAFTWGDYPGAYNEFAALLGDPGADETERQLAAYWVGRSAFEAGDYETALAKLREFIQAYPSDPLVATAHLIIARAYEYMSNWHEAVAAYQAYLQVDDTLAVYAYKDMGNAALLALDYDIAVQAFSKGLLIAPDNSWIVHMHEGIAQAELARGNPEAAINQYEAILTIARVRSYRARILYLAGQAHAMGGNQEAAYEHYAQSVNLYPEAYDSYLALIELVNAGVPVDDFHRGLVDYHAQAYQPAIEAFVRYIEASPENHKGDAHWYLGLSLKANGNLWQAIQQFQELIETHPENDYVIQAWMEMAEAHAWRDTPAQALETYRTLADKYPQSPLAVTALWKAANLELDNGDLETAAANFRDLSTRYPGTDDASEGLFKAALLDYRRADFEAARSGWQSLVQDYPDTRAGLAARFWLGKAWLALGNQNEANAAFEIARQWAPSSYYGLRAGEMLADAPESIAYSAPTLAGDPADDQIAAEAWLASWLPITSTISPPQGEGDLSTLNPAIAQSPAFRRGDALLAAGRRAEALDEFETIRETWWDDPLATYQLALAFRDRSLYRLSIICAERLIVTSPVNARRDAPRFIQQLSHPLYYRELVVSEAENQKIDPLLLFALIRQESLFESSATSPAGARGLTQVIPATGEWIAGRLGWGELSENSLLLPYVNIHFGAWYLSVQWATFDEEIFPALAAYNAGPGHIHKWLSETPDLDLFVEFMPFTEPRRYVRSIYENYAQYRWLYAIEP